MDIVGRRARTVSEEHRLRPGHSEVERLVCGNALIRELTDWKPETNLDGGLRKTVAWFQIHENARSYKHDLYNV